MDETVFKFVLGYLAIDFVCTMLNRYVFKNENKEESQLGRSHEK